MFFAVQPQGNTVSEDGQHMYYWRMVTFVIVLLVYLETGRSTSAQTLTFTIASSGTWKAKIIQLECYAPYK